MFDLEDLRAFVESADRGTFTAAAQALYLTQPSLSRRIARLEHEMGGALFDRSNRRSPRVAPLGEALLPHARRLLAEQERFAELAQAHSRGLAGSVILALSEVASEVTLPTLYRYFARRFPRLQIKIVERAPGAEVRAALLDREADLAITDNTLMSRELEGLDFGLVQHVALGVPDFLGQVESPIEWDELRRLPLLLSIAAGEVAYPIGGEALHVVHERSAPGVLRAMARAGLGVAILAGVPRSVGLHCRPISIDGTLQRSSYQLAWSRSSPLSPPAARLVEDLSARLADRDAMLLSVERAWDLLT